MTNARVLVPGATGRIGGAVAVQLLEQCFTTRAMVHRSDTRRARLQAWVPKLSARNAGPFCGAHRAETPLLARHLWVERDAVVAGALQRHDLCMRSHLVQIVQVKRQPLLHTAFDSEPPICGIRVGMESWLRT